MPGVPGFFLLLPEHLFNNMFVRLVASDETDHHSPSSIDEHARRIEVDSVVCGQTTACLLRDIRPVRYAVLKNQSDGKWNVAALPEILFDSDQPFVELGCRVNFPAHVDVNLTDNQPLTAIFVQRKQSGHPSTHGHTYPQIFKRTTLPSKSENSRWSAVFLKKPPRRQEFLWGRLQQYQVLCGQIVISILRSVPWLARLHGYVLINVVRLQAAGIEFVDAGGTKKWNSTLSDAFSDVHSIGLCAFVTETVEIDVAPGDFSAVAPQFLSD